MTPAGGPKGPGGGVRVGQGLDVHAVADDPDRPLRLGGVTIPDAGGLAGHSDADVVLHAVCDALLGAAALGDLGTVFGTDDPRYAGADSEVFVRETCRRVAGAGWSIGNVDVTVVAQEPRLAPHLDAVRASVARLLEVEVGEVSVKATTTDRLGLIGRGEGIAGLAVALLVPRA